MNDRWDDFDCSLATSLSELPPPEETVREVTPFRSAMGKVVWGLCLTSFTLQLWYLQYLLPALGAILMVLGFRSLRRNNRWFQFCWIFSICEAIYLYSIDLLAATPFMPDPDQIPLWLQGITAFGRAAVLFGCLWLGLRQAAGEVGQPRRAAAPALWALGWYTAMVLLGVLWPQPGWLVFLIMGIAFVCIVRSLLRLSESLGSWGYAVRAAPVRIGGGRLAAAYLLSLAALTAALCLASNHLPVEPQIVEQTSDSSEITAIRGNLTALGFPEEWLALLPEDELQKLAGAEACQVHLDAWGNSTDNRVRYTDIQVLTAPNTVRCYHFFTVDTRKAVLQNQVRLEPSTRVTVTDVAGQILWQKAGTRYAAELFLETDMYTPPLLGGTYDSWTALFSYPFAGTDRRGWCAYTATLPWDQDTANCSILRYQTQALRNLYPYLPLPEQPIVGMLNDLESQSYSTYDFTRSRTND